MDALEAINARHSVRDFSSKPVDKDTVMKIMETACRAPSGGNGQPWEVFIAAGATMERIRKEYQERAKNPPAGPPGGPPPQPAYIQARMAQIRKERLELLGLDPNDPESGKVFMEWGARMFGVPVLAIICQDKEIKNNMDMGLFIQSRRFRLASLSPPDGRVGGAFLPDCRRGAISAGGFAGFPLSLGNGIDFRGGTVDVCDGSLLEPGKKKVERSP